MKLLFVGDIVGRPGRLALKESVDELRERYQFDVLIANGENSAGGFGITASIAQELMSMGVDVITLGNHVWDKREFQSQIGNLTGVLRPANYPPGAPGEGWYLLPVPDSPPLAVINLMGRVFSPTQLECPFRLFDEVYAELKQKTPFIFVDFHAEATSEKAAFGWYVDGRASAVVGTHTHIQTADERILPQGTAYMTDVGMTGPCDSVLGIDPETIIKKFLTQMPARFDLAKGARQLNAVIVDLDENGRAIHIERLFLHLHEDEEDTSPQR